MYSYLKISYLPIKKKTKQTCKMNSPYILNLLEGSQSQNSY